MTQVQILPPAAKFLKKLHSATVNEAECAKKSANMDTGCKKS